MDPAVSLIHFSYSLGSLFAAKNYSMVFPNENFGQTLRGSSRSILRFKPPALPLCFSKLTGQKPR